MERFIIEMSDVNMSHVADLMTIFSLSGFISIFHIFFSHVCFDAFDVSKRVKSFFTDVE